MIVERLTSGNFTLFGEKITKKILDSKVNINIYSNSNSILNITNPRNFSNLNYSKKIYWKIGNFEFSNNKVIFNNLNYLTNDLNSK